jgi:hypothetical protein
MIENNTQVHNQAAFTRTIPFPNLYAPAGRILKAQQYVSNPVPLGRIHLLQAKLASSMNESNR